MILAVNAKVYYPYSFGARLLRLARAIDKVAKEYSITTIIAPPHTELKEVKDIVEVTKVYAQHLDPVEPGAHTGSVILEGIKEIIDGSIINHSEKRMRLDEIELVVSKLRRAGKESLVCAPTPNTAAAVAALRPSMIAMEPPELIGTGVSVSRARPETVVETVRAVKGTGFAGPVLVGAGISSGEDVRKAIELGADGVLVASAVVKADDPYVKLKEFAEAMVR
ncbi:triose-phosphate isomerase [Ignicoccus hospitalis]|uniref:Triosephosphate isomerase n=1 Tax=Ignicoccus hospitalis (strain KIN4/I / DSM 18386 / JCM 14125) TaxID=453591 RepID=A8AAC6_IGNH4|nr:triose-phosphate isomerase [Ignicoccus hospitalis]ABU81878.1 triosephosphate isomerase [Ignicoccus hospitalis KIN4/I]HIH89964.1 triose-phosphate isomerase [Desulfurococcaceae archaeon]